MDDRALGRHLIVTGFVSESGCDRLNDSDSLAHLLHEIIDAVDMEVLSPAHMIRVDLDPEKANSPDDCGGVTGTAILSTSHVSIHTWPLHGRFSFDIYSCKDFDAKAVVKLLEDRLGMSGGEVVDLVRTPNPDLRTKLLWRSL